MTHPPCPRATALPLVLLGLIAGSASPPLAKPAAKPPAPAVPQKADAGELPVVEGGRAVGLLPFRCVAEVPRAEWDRRLVRDCMLSLDAVPRLRENDELVYALGELSAGSVQRGLVLDGDRLVGLLSISDLARALETGPRPPREETVGV